jgi:hypothetical protein
MEFWTWFIALAAGLMILTIALIWAVSRAVVLGKKLRPFAAEVANFKKSAEQYPEAVEFYRNLAQSQEKPAKTSVRSKRMTKKR